MASNNNRVKVHQLQALKVGGAVFFGGIGMSAGVVLALDVASALGPAIPFDAFRFAGLPINVLCGMTSGIILWRGNRKVESFFAFLWAVAALGMMVLMP